MEPSLHNTIFKTLSEVFEKMFFLALHPLGELPPSEEWTVDSHIEAAITFTGSKSGTIHFYFPSGLARYLTVNFLDLQGAEVSDSQIFDTVRETANMAVGSLLGQLDPDGECRLGIPEAKPLGKWTPEPLLAKSGVSVFHTEIGLLWLLYEEK